jgi:hypothetical protein
LQNDDANAVEQNGKHEIIEVERDFDLPIFHIEAVLDGCFNQWRRCKKLMVCRQPYSKSVLMRIQMIDNPA